MSRPLGADEASRGRAAVAMFGPGMSLAERYADLLRGDGVAHGHLGPREADRLWDRHLLNCAVMTDLLPEDSRVIDVGSGAGLPGLPIAIRRPDLRVTLVEPMQRRVDFLLRCIGELGLHERVDVVRGRAADPETVRLSGAVSWVTARAVAPLDRLVGWCLPLLREDGVVLAMKGEQAQDEVVRHRAALRRSGMRVRSIEELPAGDSITRVVVVERVPVSGPAGRQRRGGR